MAGQPQRDLKKQRELQYVEAFLSMDHRADWHIRPELCERSERPDVLLDTPLGLVGIEVTQRYKQHRRKRGSPLAERDSMHARFLRDSAGLYYDGGGSPAHVRVIAQEWTGGDAAMFASFLRAARPAVQWHRVRLRDVPGIRARSSTVYLRALPEGLRRYDRWDCVSDGVGWLQRLTPEDLQECVQSKARNLQAYRERAARIILLIVSDRRRASGGLVMPDSPIRLDSCGFDEVHVMTFPDGLHRVS